MAASCNRRIREIGFATCAVRTGSRIEAARLGVGHDSEVWVPKFTAGDDLGVLGTRGRHLTIGR